MGIPAPPPWWIEGTPGYYRVRLEHPQFGVRLEGVHSDTIIHAEAAGEAAFPGYRAVWSHRQREIPPPNISSAPQH